MATLLQGAAGASPLTAGGANSVLNFQGGFSPSHRVTLISIAKDTWGFYSRDIDPATNLPIDNLTFAGGSATPTADGTYTSAADVGVYLWAVATAYDSR
ncbi:MAG TPA: hypothetical protein VMF65_06175 [Acidimicrobiales bacterium]|nr:hypothetical protein [Acidimicrobiales bacterium]